MNERIKKRKIPLYVILLVIGAYLTALAAVGFGFFASDRYDISPGMPSPDTFRAHRNIENFHAMELAQEAAAAAVVPSLMHDPSISAEILSDLEEFFIQAGALRAEYMPIYSPFTIQQALNDDEERPLPDFSELMVGLDYEAARHIITGDSATFARFFADITGLFEESLEIGINPGGSVPAAVAVTERLRQLNFDEIYISIGHAISVEILRSNNVINEELTEIMRQEARDAVEPVIFVGGQNIVLEGEIVSDEAYRALVELGYIGGAGAAMFANVAGSALIVTIIFVVALCYIYLFKNDIIENRRQTLLLFTLYLVTIILARIMVVWEYYLTPIMLFAMLVSILIDTRLSVVMTMAVSIIVVVMDPADTMFVTFAIINGVFAAMIAKRVVIRGRFFTTILALAAVNAATVSANYFLFSTGFSMQLINSAVFAVLGGLVTIWLCIGTLPLWESIFDVTTPNTLLELTNPNNILLRRMAVETPGTYHHSLVVANLSETACYDIGANHGLARVGAYYHDIGKMKYPQYFAENQNGINPHDELPPRTSVEVITDHITRGLELAKQHKLPLPIRDFIEEHHGNSLIKVFYHKEKNLHPDEEIDENDFRYKNRTPSSPETAVVMLADTCEAAVRSMVTKSGKNVDEMDSFVRKLIKDKLEDGQLNESGLSIKDLDTIAKAFMRVFKGMYHERIPYPSATARELVSGTMPDIPEIPAPVIIEEGSGDIDGTRDIDGK